ncbi:MAG: TPM domain-containing protein [Treponema sp.]|nr:TPM domain-containing protein [Treponema sp.]
MVKSIVKKAAAAVMIFAPALCFSQQFASVLSGYDGQLVIDSARVFSAATVEDTEAQLQELTQKTGSTQLIVTVKNTANRTPEAYADDLYEMLYGIDTEGALLLVVTEDTRWNSTGRYVHLSTSGENTIAKISDAAVNTLCNAFVKGFERGGYDEGVRLYMKKLSEHLKNGITGAEAAASSGASLISMVTMFFATKKKYKMKKQRAIYNVQHNSVVNFANVADTLINSRTSVRRIARDSSGGGGSGGGGSSTHTSSGGGTHGGGGRGF